MTELVRGYLVAQTVEFTPRGRARVSPLAGFSEHARDAGPRRLGAARVPRGALESARRERQERGRTRRVFERLRPLPQRTHAKRVQRAPERHPDARAARQETAA